MNKIDPNLSITVNISKKKKSFTGLAKAVYSELLETIN